MPGTSHESRCFRSGDLETRRARDAPEPPGDGERAAAEIDEVEFSTFTGAALLRHRV